MAVEDELVAGAGPAQRRSAVRPGDPGAMPTKRDFGAEMGALDEQLNRFMEISKSGGAGMSREHLESLKQELGVYGRPQADVGNFSEDHAAGATILSGLGAPAALLGGLLGGRSGKAALDHSRYLATRESDEMLGQKIQEHLRGLVDRKKGLTEEAINARLAGVTEQENMLRQQLLGQQGQYAGAIDNRMNLLLEQAGMQGNEARMGIGAAAADRGMLRSTMASRGLNEATLAEQEQKGQVRSQADQAKMGVARTVDDTIKGIEDRRKQLAAKRDLGELNAFEQVGFDFDANKIKQQFDNEISQMKLDAQSSGFLGSMAGGVFQGVGKLFFNAFGGK